MKASKKVTWNGGNIIDQFAEHRAEQKRLMAERRKEYQKIKKYCNRNWWTDVTPNEVVNVISEQTVEIRAMDTEIVRSPQEFHAGGFVGHFSDNRQGQEYKYISNPENEIVRLRFSKAKNRWQDANGGKYSMADAPYKFYDYNF